MGDLETVFFGDVGAENAPTVATTKLKQVITRIVLSNNKGTTRNNYCHSTKQYEYSMIILL
jgi:hypothetical protein